MKPQSEKWNGIAHILHGMTFGKLCHINKVQMYICKIIPQQKETFYLVEDASEKWNYYSST